MAVGVFDHCRKIAPGDVLQAQSETSILKSLLKTGFSDQQFMDSIGRDLFHYQDCTAKFGSLSNGMAILGGSPFRFLFCLRGGETAGCRWLYGTRQWRP